MKTLIARSGFNPHAGHVVPSLNKTFYDDYFCLVPSNKQLVMCPEEFEEIKSIDPLKTPKQA